MAQESQENLLLRLSTMPSQGIEDSTQLELKYRHKMQYPLIKETYYAMAVLENYMDGDVSAPENIILDRVHQLLYRTLGIQPIGPIDETGMPEFGGRCFAPIIAKGALTLEDNNELFISLKNALSKTDIDLSLFEYKEFLDSNKKESQTLSL